MKKILVTGSSGTIGTRLCERLAESGFLISPVDKRPNAWNADIDRQTCRVDLCDKARVLTDLPKDADMIVHLAANARVYNLVVDPSLARDNFEMMFNVLEFARVNGIRRVLFSSSREVYGNTGKDILREEDASIDACESTYTASKIGGEALLRAYHRCYGIDFLIFRFSNVYGMYDASDRVIPLFIRLAKAGRDLVIYGKEKLLDFTYIDDVAGAVLSVIQKFEAVQNTVVNIAYGRGTRLSDVAGLIVQGTHSPSRTILKENRTGEVVRYIADISRARGLLGYEPMTPIEEGVRRSIAWYAEHPYENLS